MSARFDGKVALVTGATSGIGRASAEVLAREGADVMVTGRSADSAARTVLAIVEAGGSADIALGDIRDPNLATSIVAATRDRFGSVDVLVNAAGVIVRHDVVDTSDEDWRLVMGTNLDALFYVSRAAVVAMRQAGGGSIVNIASNVGLVGTSGLAAYCASKGAVISLTRAMALDHATEKIRVNAVCPGSVDTPMLVSGRAGRGVSDEEVFAANISAIPQGRIPQPSEVAEAVAFLASDASSHITGTAIPVDGGYVAQ